MSSLGHAVTSCRSAAYGRDVYRFLLSRRWFGGLALAIVAAICCILLARWQWQRREVRLERNAIVTQNWGKTPSSLSSLMPRPGAILPQNQQWTPVDLTGTYLGAGTVLLRNRPLDGEPGYRVLVPLRTTSGVLYVDRGWVPIGQTGARPDAVPAPPAGQIHVVARVRPAEVASRKSAPQGQAQSVTPSEFQDDLRRTTSTTAPVYTGVYAVLAREDPPAATQMPLFAEPELDEGPHLSYAIQWCIFAGMFLGMWVVVVRRQAAEMSDDEPRPLKTRRVTDEDVEDYQVDHIAGDSGSRS